MATGITGPVNISDFEIVVIRYLNDGTVDMDFGEEGIVLLDLGLSDLDFCNAIAIQPDGKILLSGETIFFNDSTLAEEWDIVVIRLNVDGSLDSTFGKAGIVISNINSDFEMIREILIQTDDRIIATGSSGPNFAMIRFQSNGEVDSTFGNKGIVLTAIQNIAQSTSAVLQTDGKIVLGGYTRSEFNKDFALVRYLNNGNIDSTFGTFGIVQTDLEVNENMDLAQTLIIDSNGKLVLGGFANFSYTPARSDIT